MRGYRRIIRYALRQWPGLLAIVAITVTGSLLTALQPWPIKILFDDALGDRHGSPGLDSLLRWNGADLSPRGLIIAAAVASLVIFLLNSLIDFAASWTWSVVGQRMVYDLAGDLFARLQRLSLLFHTRRSVGDSLNRLTGDSWCVYTVTDALLISPVQHVATLLAVGTAAYLLDPGLAFVALAVAPVLAASAFFFGRRLKQKARTDRDTIAKLTGFVHQTLTNLPIVQSFATEDRNRDHFRALAHQSTTAARKGAFIRGGFTLVNGLASSVGVAIVLYLGGLHVLAGTLSAGSLLALMVYVNSLRSASQGLLNTYANLRAAEASIDRVLEVLDAEELVREKPGAVAAPVGPQAGHVKIENVTFEYEVGRAVLNDVTLEAAPGELVALVGRTGAGKSTLVSLVPRFFDPLHGRVTLGGVDVSDMKIADLRSRVSLVLQEVFLLPLTIAENIAYGRPGASMDQIIAAAKAADAHGFITALPRGYNTVLGERGATLSGGQRQRLSIARAILKDAPILILDEPTSALDTQTESAVLSALEHLMAGRTTLVIAHRLSTVRRATRIVVLDGGRVAEQGTHQQLLANHGPYHALYESQFAEPETAPREATA